MSGYQDQGSGHIILLGPQIMLKIPRTLLESTSALHTTTTEETEANTEINTN